jgi:hypothetical protein
VLLPSSHLLSSTCRSDPFQVFLELLVISFVDQFPKFLVISFAAAACASSHRDVVARPSSFPLPAMLPPPADPFTRRGGDGADPFSPVTSVRTRMMTMAMANWRWGRGAVAAAPLRAVGWPCREMPLPPLASSHRRSQRCLTHTVDYKEHADVVTEQVR